MKAYEIKIPITKLQLQLSGSLLTNAIEETLMIIIPGTGPVDRDGNLNKMEMNLYKDLAEGLAQIGISSFRFDKPGVGTSTGDFNRIGLFDLVETVTSIVTYFKQSRIYSFKKIILLGHSEGTILATLASNQIEVDGMILLGGAGSDLKTVMKAQNDRLISEVSMMRGLPGALLRTLMPKEKMFEKQNILFDKVNQTNADTLKISGQVIQAKWLREHLSISQPTVLNILGNLAIPTLIINGDKDVQINSKAFEEIINLNNSFLTVEVISNMNHMLKEQKESISMLKLKKIYKSMEKFPVSYRLIEAIESWTNQYLSLEE